MNSRFATFVMLALICGATFASGAPWYRWINKIDRTTLCSRTSPGNFWVMYKGPYMESQCRKPGNPQ
jgi:hypothetical protein